MDKQCRNDFLTMISVADTTVERERERGYLFTRPPEYFASCKGVVVPFPKREGKEKLCHTSVPLRWPASPVFCAQC